MTHERSVTLKNAEGRFVNVPSVVQGRQIPDDQIEGMVLRGELKPLGGQTFASMNEAVEAAKARSEAAPLSAQLEQFAQQQRLSERGAVDIPGAPVEPEPLSQQLMKTLPLSTQLEQPGMFRRRFVEPGVRVKERFTRGFAEGFGEMQTRPVTVGRGGVALQVLTNVGTALQGAGELVLRGSAGVYLGALSSTEQLLQELGMERGNARRTVRDLHAAGDVLGISTIFTPGPATARTLRQTRRKLTKADAVDFERAKIQREKAERAKARTLNAAKKAARAKATAGQPPGASPAKGDIVEAGIEVAGRRQADAEVQLMGETFIRAPDEIMDFVIPHFEEVLTPQVQRNAIAVAQRVLAERGGIQPNTLAPRRVQQMVVDLLNSDDAFSIRLFAEAEAAGLSKQDFLRRFLFTGSEAGRTLQARSRFLDPFRERALRGDKQAEDILRETFGNEGRNKTRIGPKLTPLEASEGWFSASTRIFRKLLISLPATATRNLIDSGLFRLTLRGANDALDQTLQRVFLPSSRRGVGPRVVAEELEPIGESFALLGRVWGSIPREAISKLSGGRIAPSKSKQLIDRVIAAFPEVRNRAFASLDADISIQSRAPGFLNSVENGIDKFGLALNRAQEFIVRRQVLASKLDIELRKLGTSLEEVVDTGFIPKGLNGALTTAIEDALFTSFSLRPRGKQAFQRFFRGYGEVIEASRVLAFLEPFPSFIFNLTKLIAENTATGGLRLMRPVSRAKIAEGDFDPLVRELTGTVLFATAIAIRQGDFPGITPGERFDEVLTADGNLTSMAPFATIIPHLYLADLVIRMDEGRLSPSDFEFFKEARRGMFSSAPQVARFNDALEDAYNASFDISTAQDFGALSEFLGETATGFLRPFQLVRDFREEFNEAIALQRETRGRGFMGPVLNMLDPEQLPERESPTREETLRSPRVKLPFVGELSAGLVSQASGLRLRQPRNPIESEIARLGIGTKQLSPKVGDKRLDALVLRFQGPMLEMLGNVVVTGDIYRTLPVRTQQEIVRNLINITREPAIEMAKRLSPASFVKRAIERLPGTQRGAIHEQLDLMLRAEGLDFTVDDIMDDFAKMADRELKAQGL